jgi:hypothetical protein
VSLIDWCKRIYHFLQVGESFMEESFDVEPSAKHIYAMLPPLWYAMPPEKKKLIAALVDRHSK